MTNLEDFLKAVDPQPSADFDERMQAMPWQQEPPRHQTWLQAAAAAAVLIALIGAFALSLPEGVIGEPNAAADDGTTAGPTPTLTGDRLTAIQTDLFQVHSRTALPKFMFEAVAPSDITLLSPEIERRGILALADDPEYSNLYQYYGAARHPDDEAAVLGYYNGVTQAITLTLGVAEERVFADIGNNELWPYLYPNSTAPLDGPGQALTSDMRTAETLTLPTADDGQATLFTGSWRAEPATSALMSFGAQTFGEAFWSATMPLKTLSWQQNGLTYVLMDHTGEMDTAYMLALAEGVGPPSAEPPLRVAGDLNYLSPVLGERIQVGTDEAAARLTLNLDWSFESDLTLEVAQAESGIYITPPVFEGLPLTGVSGSTPGMNLHYVKEDNTGIVMVVRPFEYVSPDEWMPHNTFPESAVRPHAIHTIGDGQIVTGGWEWTGQEWPFTLTWNHDIPNTFMVWADSNHLYMLYAVDPGLSEQQITEAVRTIRAPEPQTLGPVSMPDAVGDVEPAHADVTDFTYSVDADGTLTTTFTLRDLPEELPRNREGVPADAIDYMYRVYIWVSGRNETEQQPDRVLQAGYVSTGTAFRPVSPLEDFFEMYTAWEDEPGNLNWRVMGGMELHIDTDANTITIISRRPLGDRANPSAQGRYVGPDSTLSWEVIDALNGTDKPDQ